MYLTCGVAVLKTCTKCGVEKPETEFFKYSGRPGVRPSCKVCMTKAKAPCKPETKRAYLERTAARRSEWQKEYYANNREACALRVKRAIAKNFESFRQYRDKWRKENKDRLVELARMDRARNPGRYREYKAKRRAALLRAIPPWANLDEIRQLYEEAAKMSEVHVDHIVPLISPIVCGLHCSANLQIIGASENCSKGNRIWPDMP